MSDAIPIYEAKNKLPLFIHQAETDGPIFNSRRNKSVAVLIALDDYNDLLHRAEEPKKKMNVVERVATFKERNGWPITDEDIDEVFGDVRDHTPISFESHVFDGIMEDLDD